MVHLRRLSPTHKITKITRVKRVPVADKKCYLTVQKKAPILSRVISVVLTRAVWAV